jgi:hypothetical protein
MLSKRLNNLKFDVLPSILWPDWYRIMASREVVRDYNRMMVLKGLQPYQSRFYGD